MPRIGPLVVVGEDLGARPGRPGPGHGRRTGSSRPRGRSRGRGSGPCRAEGRRAGPGRGRGRRRVARLDRAGRSPRRDRGAVSASRGSTARRRRRARRSGSGQGTRRRRWASARAGRRRGRSSARLAPDRRDPGRHERDQRDDDAEAREPRRGRGGRRRHARVGGMRHRSLHDREPAGASGPRPWPSRVTAGPPNGPPGGYAVVDGSPLLSWATGRVATPPA